MAERFYFVYRHHRALSVYQEELVANCFGASTSTYEISRNALAKELDGSLQLDVRIDHGVTQSTCDPSPSSFHPKHPHYSEAASISSQAPGENISR